MITARGWTWEQTGDNASWIAFRCNCCGQHMTYPRNRVRKPCVSCGGKNTAIGYARKVKQVKKKGADEE